ncbi:MAG TPA: hypothetical protein VIO38_09285, partial [Rariglobus sp.]
AGLSSSANRVSSQTFTLQAGGGAVSAKTISVGPLTLVGPSISIADFGFADGKLILSIAMGVTSGSLAFGSGGSGGITATITGLRITFDIAVGLPGDFSLSATGKFSVEVATLEIDVPNVVNIRAAGILIQYDPAATGVQELVRINSASLSFLNGQVVGSISQVTDANGQLIPGLVVRSNGFTLGQAEIMVAPAGGINVGSVLKLKDVRVGVTNFTVVFGDTNPGFSGTIYIASGGASLTLGGSFTATITDRNTADDVNADGSQNTEAVRAALEFENGQVKGLIFKVDTLSVQVASLLTLSAKDFLLNTSAADDAVLVSFGAVGASVKIGSAVIGGEARNFYITGDGAFHAGNHDDPSKKFAVILNIGGVDGGTFKWPAWMPIKITQLGLEWADIDNHPENFDIILSASVVSIAGAEGFSFSGTIEGVRISTELLLNGEFPITDIASIGVSISGDMGGMQVSGALIGGIIKIGGAPGAYSIIDATDTSTPVVDRVFFMGLQGSATISGIGGFGIRMAFSELGPLGLFINVNIPGGILLEPTTGLTINDFSASVEFFKTLPSISDPLALRSPEFSVSPTVSAENWLASVKGQVLNQWAAIQANPSLNGFSAAFTQPMLIKGSGKVYSMYTSQELFNGQVDIIISTDGKFLITGKLNFLADQLSVSGKLYADLSNVANGEVTVLFLADLPDQIRLLTVDGKLKMGFRDDTGSEVTLTAANLDAYATPGPTSGSVLLPSTGNADASVLNAHKTADNRYYIDVVYTPGAGGTLDYASILDSGAELSATFTRADGTVVTLTLAGAPKAIATVIDANGVSSETVITAASTADLITTLEARGIQRFRYEITTSGFAWSAGTLQVDFVASSWTQKLASGATGLANVAATTSIQVQGTTAVLANPVGGANGVAIAFINSQGYIDVTFLTAKLSGSIAGLASGPPLILAGSGAGTVVLSATGVRQGTTNTYRYTFTGEFAPGDVTVTLAAGAVTDNAGYTNLQQTLSFTVNGATAAVELGNYGSSGSATIGIDTFKNLVDTASGLSYIEITFKPGSGTAVTAASLYDGAAEIEILLADGTTLTVSADPLAQAGALIGTNTYRYTYSGTLVAGAARIRFIAGSFADDAGTVNLEAETVVTLTRPSATATNVGNGGGYYTTTLNTPANKYFEFTLTPSTSGASIDFSTLSASDLIISMVNESGAVVSGVTITGFTRVNDGNGNPTNTVRFAYTGDFNISSLSGRIVVTLSMAEGAFSDTAGNGSAAATLSFTVRKPATSFYISLSGGITLNGAGFTSEPLLDIRGSVNFEAKEVDGGGVRFQLDFNGTIKVIYLGNLGSVAGIFVLDTSSPVNDAEVLTVREFFADFGVTIGAGVAAGDIKLPKLWGVIKLESNLDFLKTIGIDIKLAGTLQVNTTKVVKTETLTLEGIAGDLLTPTSFLTNPDATAISSLDAAHLTATMLGVFTTAGITLGAGYEVRTVVAGSQWRVIDSVNKKQYFIQLQDVSGMGEGAASTQVLNFRGETQTFHLAAKTLLIAGYAYAKFTIGGSELFAISGAFSIKLSTTSIEMFADGRISFTPGGTTIFEARVQALVLAGNIPLGDRDNNGENDGNVVGLAGKFKLGASLNFPGVEIGASLDVLVNTTGEDILWSVPVFLRGATGYDTIEISGTPQKLNAANFNPATGGSLSPNGSALTDDTSAT